MMMKKKIITGSLRWTFLSMDLSQRIDVHPYSKKSSFHAIYFIHLVKVNATKMQQCVTIL